MSSIQDPTLSDRLDDISDPPADVVAKARRPRKQQQCYRCQSSRYGCGLERPACLNCTRAAQTCTYPPPRHDRDCYGCKTSNAPNCDRFLPSCSRCKPLPRDCQYTKVVVLVLNKRANGRKCQSSQEGASTSIPMAILGDVPQSTPTGNLMPATQADTETARLTEGLVWQSAPYSTADFMYHPSTLTTDDNRCPALYNGEGAVLQRTYSRHDRPMSSPTEIEKRASMVGSDDLPDMTLQKETKRDFLDRDSYGLYCLRCNNDSTEPDPPVLTFAILAFSARVISPDRGEEWLLKARELANEVDASTAIVPLIILALIPLRMCKHLEQGSEIFRNALSILEHRENFADENRRRKLWSICFVISCLELCHLDTSQNRKPYDFVLTCCPPNSELDCVFAHAEPHSETLLCDFKNLGPRAAKRVTERFGPGNKRMSGERRPDQMRQTLVFAAHLKREQDIITYEIASLKSHAEYPATMCLLANAMKISAFEWEGVRSQILLVAKHGTQYLKRIPTEAGALLPQDDDEVAFVHAVLQKVRLTSAQLVDENIEPKPERPDNLCDAVDELTRSLNRCKDASANIFLISCALDAIASLQSMATTVRPKWTRKWLDVNYKIMEEAKKIWPGAEENLSRLQEVSKDLRDPQGLA